MSEQKRYTAKDFRHAVFARQARMNAVPLVHPTEDELDEMLEQAADAEDELAQLKARLDAAAKPMPNTPTTPASVASRLTDEEHKREELKLKYKIRTLQDIIEANKRMHAASEQADSDRKLELNGEIVKRDRMIAGLRECLKEARRELCKECSSKGFKCKKSEPCVTVLNIDIALHNAPGGAEDDNT